MSATITGSVIDLGAAWAVNSTIKFTAVAVNNIATGRLVNSAVPIATKVKPDGTFSQVLPAGGYYVMFESGADRWVINVPDDNNSYDIVGRIVPAYIPPTNPLSVPNASSTVAGLLKTVKDDIAPVVPTGVYFPNDVAALKALATKTGNTYATLIKRLGGEPKYFYWDGTRNDADDPAGFMIVRPTDFVSAGSLGVWVQDT